MFSPLFFFSLFFLFFLSLLSLFTQYHNISHLWSYVLISPLRWPKSQPSWTSKVSLFILYHPHISGRTVKEIYRYKLLRCYHSEETVGYQDFMEHHQQATNNRLSIVHRVFTDITKLRESVLLQSYTK